MVAVSVPVESTPPKAAVYEPAPMTPRTVDVRVLIGGSARAHAARLLGPEVPAIGSSPVATPVPGDNMSRLKFIIKANQERPSR